MAHARRAPRSSRLDGCLTDLDGFYTFAVGTADGFAVLRDPIACKPAVLAETATSTGGHVVEWRAIAFFLALPTPRRGSPNPSGVRLGEGKGA